MDVAARDTILLQTRDNKLQHRILSSDLNYANTIKHGLALEEEERKVDNINSKKERWEDS